MRDMMAEMRNDIGFIIGPVPRSQSYNERRTMGITGGIEGLAYCLGRCTS